MEAHKIFHLAPPEARAATKTQYQFAVTLQEYRTQVPNSLAFDKDIIVEDVVCSHGPFWSGRMREARRICVSLIGRFLYGSTANTTVAS
jgi:hypothetical protein